MNLVERIKEKARADVKRIVLPEGDEPRTVKAAKIIREEGLADPVLLTAEEIAAPAASDCETLAARAANASTSNATRMALLFMVCHPFRFCWNYTKKSRARQQGPGPPGKGPVRYSRARFTK